MSEKKHALLSCSGGKKWVECPGSIWLSRQCPELPATDASIYGTIGHDWAEELLKVMFSKGKGLRSKFEALCLGYEVENKTLLSAVKKYLLTCRDVYNKLKQGAIKADVYIEQRVEVFEHTFGTADFIMLIEQEPSVYDIAIVDLKTGGWQVEVDSNYQTTLYAIGAVRKFVPVGSKVRNIHMYICQPRVSPSVSYSLLTIEELLEKQKFLKEAHDYAYDLYTNGAKDSDFKAGEWCHFCPARKICKISKE